MPASLIRRSPSSASSRAMNSSTNDGRTAHAGAIGAPRAGAGTRTVDVPPLVCPTCRGELAAGEDAASLRCTGGHTWPILHGIPRFVPADNYAAAFGAQWIAFPRTQLDSHTGVPLSRDRAHRCLGPEVLGRLQRGETVRVLEVGCGAGRFTEVLLQAGATVTSVDLSSAVEANQKNFPQSDAHRILQADVRQLPFAPQQFDVVFCLGVVQHTPSPEETIGKLYEQVRPGGLLVIDHYPPNRGWYLSLAPLWRAALKRLPPDRKLPTTQRIVDAFLPLHSRFRHNTLALRLLARISPVLTYYRDHPELAERDQRQWALLDTHDAMTDWYKHRRSPAQLTAIARALGAADLWCERGGNGVELRCRRPAGA